MSRPKHEEVAYEQLKQVELPVMEPPPVYVFNPADAVEELDAGIVPEAVPYKDWLDAHDYQVNLGSIFTRAWLLYKKQWCTITLTFLLVTGSACIPFVGWLVSAFLGYGFIFMILNGMRVNNPGGFMRFNDVFGAFSLFLPVCGLMLFQCLISVAMMLVLVVCCVFAYQLTHSLYLILAIALILCVPMSYVCVCVHGATPVLLEFHTVKVGVFASIRHSFHQITRHLLPVMAMQAFIAIFQISGFFAFFVGGFVTVPLGFVAQMFLFKDMFGMLARDFRAGECVFCV